MFGKTADGWRSKLKTLLSRASGEKFPKEELEALLYEADLPASLVARLANAAAPIGLRTRENVTEKLVQEVVKALAEQYLPPRPLPRPGAILLLGVNGSGKTTVAGKLAKKFRDQEIPVVLAAADTFRAGAIEQLRLWGTRVGAEVIAQKEGADPGAVVFDAWQKAVSQNAMLIADTAGRLHTKQPLLEELKKVVRILGKDGRGAPHECYLVLDGTTGQNAISQAKEFMKAVPVTGLIVTKLDGTARGGSMVAASLELSQPIRYIGVGEKPGDLLDFDAATFARELFRV
ncbi:MAG TPA: signal recognition particle-docking protein FtsY [Bdellovibrionota bacterium]|nr:signal recognition particle-docking protein FtsY [Bdellovibrionota bacterium]